MRRRRGGHVAAVVLLLGAAAASCGGDGTKTVGPSSGSPLSEYVTGAAATNLHGGAAFTLAAPGIDLSTEMPSPQAERIAEIFAHQFAHVARSAWDAQHGAPIDYAALKHCGRPLYAASAYERQPSTVDRAARSEFGPWWIVGLCGAAGDQQMSVAVSSLATDLTVTPTGLIFPAISGNEIRAIGVPPAWHGPLPTQPEDAVERVARATGRRIAEVPSLIAPALRDGGPFASSWRLALDQPRGVRGLRSNAAGTVSVVYLGRSGQWDGATGQILPDDDIEVPTASQPAAITFQARDVAALRGMLGSPFTGEIPMQRQSANRVAGVPVRFERATLSAEN